MACEEVEISQVPQRGIETQGRSKVQQGQTFRREDESYEIIPTAEHKSAKLTCSVGNSETPIKHIVTLSLRIYDTSLTVRSQNDQSLLRKQTVS